MNTPRQASRAVGALVVLLCCGVLAGCSSDPAANIAQPDFGTATIVGEPDTSAADAADIETVVMVGDSITVGATAELEAQFDALGLDHVIEAERGKRMTVSAPGNPSGASAAAALAGAEDREPSAEVWVVALGTNDIGQYSSPDEIAAAVNEVIAAVPADAALVWVDTFHRDLPEQAEAVNSIIRDSVTRRGNSVIAAWSANAPVAGMVSDDGVHPTTDGSAWFAFVVTDTVRAFLGR